MKGVIYIIWFLKKVWFFIFILKLFRKIFIMGIIVINITFNLNLFIFYNLYILKYLLIIIYLILHILCFLCLYIFLLSNTINWLLFYIYLIFTSIKLRYLFFFTPLYIFLDCRIFYFQSCYFSWNINFYCILIYVHLNYFNKIFFFYIINILIFSVTFLYQYKFCLRDWLATSLYSFWDTEGVVMVSAYIILIEYDNYENFIF